MLEGVFTRTKSLTFGVVLLAVLVVYAALVNAPRVMALQTASSAVVFDQVVWLRLIPLIRQGPVLSWGAPGEFDSRDLGGPSVLFDGGVYKMWYFGSSGTGYQIGYATSPDGRTWTKQGVVLSPSLLADSSLVAYPEVVKVGSSYRMWYTGFDGATYRILGATSGDGVVWMKQGVVLDVGPAGSADDFKVWDATVLVDGGTYDMWYTGQSTTDPPRARILLATSSDGLTWTKQGVVLSPGIPGSLDQDYVANPAVRIVGPFFEMIYMGGSGGDQRLFYARSLDGVSWEKKGLALDVLAPDESPSVVQPTFLVESNGSRSVYYAARGTAGRIYYAILSSEVRGQTESTAVAISQRVSWGSFEQTVVVPPSISIALGVIDAPMARHLA